jgi:hypothetical protein
MLGAQMLRASRQLGSSFVATSQFGWTRHELLLLAEVGACMVRKQRRPREKLRINSGGRERRNYGFENLSQSTRERRASALSAALRLSNRRIL